MKRIIGLFLMICLAFSPLATSFAEEEIYWGQAPPTDSEITDDDFSIDFNKTQTLRTFGDQEIYDTYKASDLLSDPESPADTETRATTAEPIQLQRPARNVQPSSPPGTVPASPAPARVTPATPKPAETAPGSVQPASSPDSTPSAGVGQTPGNQELDKPATKKMKWGQTESKNVESADRFQWGKKNTSE